MHLELSNICGLKSASIKLDGITVITGLNNTGKSTIGKVLFFIFNSLSNMQEKTRNEKFEAILTSLHSTGSPHFGFATLATKICSFKKDSIEISSFESFLKQEMPKVFLEEEKEKENIDYNNLAKKILEILSVSDEKFINKVLDNNIRAVFSGTINNNNQPDGIASIALKIKNNKSNFAINNNKIIDAQNVSNLSTETVYIDDPFVIDLRLSLSHPLALSASVSEMQRHLLRALYGTDKKNLISQIIVDEKLKKVFEKINAVCDGTLEQKGDGNHYVQQEDGRSLPIGNVSAGLKIFLIIKTLLLNGSVTENGTIILDEPEIHLHPEWQLLFAEIIVLLQKIFNLHILLTTHSHYFTSAIEAYSKQHCIEDKCAYYLSGTENDHFIFTEVTSSMEKIYEKFLEPLERLASDASSE